MTTRAVEHGITVAAPAEELYRLIADIGNWPRLFPPTVHVDHLEHGAREERIRIWATANGEPKSWTSRRTLDPEQLRIDFRQEVSAPPVASMGGAWIVEPQDAGSSRIRLLHDYRAVDDDPEQLAWIDTAVDRNSAKELAALKSGAELAVGAAELLLDFEDSVRIDGSAADAFDFVNDALRWPERLPHVARVHLTEDVPGLQTLEMDTRATDGSVHTTESVRVCFAPSRIVYKQTTLPPLMALHTGCWSFLEEDGVTTATSRHTVILKPENITKLLGGEAGVPQARDFIRKALGTNSGTTLAHAKEYAEKQRSG